MSLRHSHVLLLCAVAAQLVAADLPSPTISRVYPLGGERGTSVDVEILGKYLSNAKSVEFDCRDLTWTKTVDATSGRLTGVISVAPDAALGPHMLNVATGDGDSNYAMFNVGQFADVREAEPNDRIRTAQHISGLPVEVQGILEGAVDTDLYEFQARAGERWSIELRSIEYGSAVQAKMFLLDSEGQRVSYNADRDDYLETPFIEHTFEDSGTYHIKVDQYRGPRGFNFGKNSSYILRVSALPTIRFVSPLGGRVGTRTRITLAGTGLDSVEQVYLTQARMGEYARMTYPYTMPIHFGPDPATGSEIPRIEGSIVRRADTSVVADIPIPTEARNGLWRVWAAGPHGVADGPSIELSSLPEFDEQKAADADWRRGGYVVNGELAKPREQDVYAIHVFAGRPLHFQTLATQLGMPHLDSVITLRDSGGKRLAENDDVVAGQGTLIGNPDSSLFYTPKEDGIVFLVLKDRTGRGGPSYQYRLKVQSARPSFQLFTTPENFSVARGGEAEIKVHLVREEGFEGEVSVWIDGLPGSAEGPSGKFRADQLFEPNADGADMIIPEITFRIRAPESLPLGRHAMRVLGTPTAEESRPNRTVVEAQSTSIMGPLLDLWNFVRRPLPRVSMMVVEPFQPRLRSKSSRVSLRQGGTAKLDLTVASLPEGVAPKLRDLPPGVSFKVSGRRGDEVTLLLEGTSDAPVGSFDISAEALVEDRWAASRPIRLTIERPSKLRAER